MRAASSAASVLTQAATVRCSRCHSQEIKASWQSALLILLSRHADSRRGRYLQFHLACCQTFANAGLCPRNIFHTNQPPNFRPPAKSGSHRLTPKRGGCNRELIPRGMRHVQSGTPTEASCTGARASERVSERADTSYTHEVFYHAYLLCLL